jgi:hypothetical protein
MFSRFKICFAVQAHEAKAVADAAERPAPVRKWGIIFWWGTP